MSEVSSTNVPGPPTNETLPAVECAPWCEDGTGHADEWHPGDQYCHGPELRVKLAREAMLLDYGDGVRRLDYLVVSLRMEREGLPDVCLVHNEGHCVELTLPRPANCGLDLSELLETTEA